MKVVREALLGVGLGSAGLLIVWGVAGWSADFAKVVAGILLAALSILFLAEVN